MSISIVTLARRALSVCLLSAVGIANATPVATDFNLTSTAFVLGTGFGSANKLDVTFATSPVPASISLTALNPSQLFRFGTVKLVEDCINGPSSTCTSGNGNETQNLNVTARFNFANPLIGTKNVAASSTGALVGPANDSAIDLFINFAPQEFEFGTFGRFEIVLSTLEFTNFNQTQNLEARITLLNANVAPPRDLPEPVSIALIGLGLLAIGASRRKV